MSFDFDDLVLKMSTAAEAALGPLWNDARRYAQSEFSKLAETLALIEAERAAGQLSLEQAELLLDLQKNASRAVLVTVKGLDLVTAQRTLDAALGAMATLVNGVLGFSLL